MFAVNHGLGQKGVVRRFEQCERAGGYVVPVGDVLGGGKREVCVRLVSADCRAQTDCCGSFPCPNR